jgi:hypothetical protein
MKRMYQKQKRSSVKKLNQKDEDEIDNMLFSDSDDSIEEHKINPFLDQELSLRNTTPVQPKPESCFLDIARHKQQSDDLVI